MLSVSSVHPADCPGLGWPSIVAAMLEAATPDDEGSDPRQLEQPRTGHSMDWDPSTTQSADTPSERGSR